jgi:fungal STAND N-terminal Goodbye domain
MSAPSESSVLQSLLEAAFEEYEKQAGASLVGHPLVIRLGTCNSVESVTAVLEEQAQAFHKYREDDAKVMKSLKCAVQYLHTLSTSAVLSQGIAFVVCLKGLMGPVFMISDNDSIAVPTRDINSRRHWHPPGCRFLLQSLRVCPCDI